MVSLGKEILAELHFNVYQSIRGIPLVKGMKTASLTLERTWNTMRGQTWPRTERPSATGDKDEIKNCSEASKRLWLRMARQKTGLTKKSFQPWLNFMLESWRTFTFQHVTDSKIRSKSMEEDCAEAVSQSDRFGVILQSKVGKYCQAYFPFTTRIAIWTRS